LSNLITKVYYYRSLFTDVSFSLDTNSNSYPIFLIKIEATMLSFFSFMSSLDTFCATNGGPKADSVTQNVSQARLREKKHGYSLDF
jgi:hypothetical protein